MNDIKNNGYNVIDKLKSSSVEEIKEYYSKNCHNASVGMAHALGDFNLGNVIRSANFFGFKEVFYIGGKKHFDRRSTVGSHNYIPINFTLTDEEFMDQIEGKYSLVCIENNIHQYSHKTVSIYDYDMYDIVKFFKMPPLFLFGEEQSGLSEFLLNSCEKIITIPGDGTVRSMNVGSCAAIIMALYRKSLVEPLKEKYE